MYGVSIVVISPSKAVTFWDWKSIQLKVNTIKQCMHMDTAVVVIVTDVLNQTNVA